MKTDFVLLLLAQRDLYEAWKLCRYMENSFIHFYNENGKKTVCNYHIAVKL